MREERFYYEVVDSADSRFDLEMVSRQVVGGKGNKSSTLTCFPARSTIHCLASGHVLLRARRPALPRHLSWSGLATS
jgi:hypothetical protein